MPVRIRIKALFFFNWPEVDFLGRDQGIGVIDFTKRLNLLSLNPPLVTVTFVELDRIYRI